tara:strand:- start:458 stop:982 length:525 start_codon:yes stop_codon:yes gene_type:complete
MNFIHKLLFIVFFLFSFNILNAQEKISYVDMEFLMNDSEAGKSITSQLTSLHKKTIEDLKKIEDELKKEESEILKQKNVISTEEFEKKINVLRNKAQNYQKLRKENNDSLNKKRLDAMSSLVNIIQPILADYANEKTISIIFQKKNIIIGKTDLDITDDILKILNKKYKKINIK